MSELKDELVEVTGFRNTDDGVELMLVMKSSVLKSMFSRYNFTKEVESLVAKKLVDNLPMETLNTITNKIDLDAVAKIATLEMAKEASGRRSY